MHLGRIDLAGSVAEVMSNDNENFKRFLAGKASGEYERPASQVIATVGR
jgi:hypothetical protein